MKSVMNRTVSTSLSALQRRLMIAEERAGEDWLNLAENVPLWPAGERPLERGDLTGNEAYAYVPSQGIPQLLEAVVAREVSVSASTLIQPGNVAISAGALHALGLIFRDCKTQGYNKAIYAIPTFIGVHEAMVAAGLTVCPLPLTSTEADWDLLSAACTQPCTVYLNLPHNPTGRTATASYLAMLTRFAATHEVVIVYDAVYDSFVFDPQSAPTPIDWAVSSLNVMVVNSLSKNFGRPGDRIGWIVAHAATIHRLISRLEWEVVCINPGTQLTAAFLLAQGNAPLVRAVREGREAFRCSAPDAFTFDFSLPPGGTQLWLDLGVDDIEGLADYALKEFHLILTTSSNYAPALPGFLRFPTGLPSTHIRRGVRLIGQLVNEWRQR